MPAQEIAGAAKAYNAALVVLLFDRGISGKIAGQEIRGLRAALPADMPLVVSGRAVNLLAKPIANVHTAADFSSVHVAGCAPQASCRPARGQRSAGAFGSGVVRASAPEPGAYNARHVASRSRGRSPAASSGTRSG